MSMTHLPETGEGKMESIYAGASYQSVCHGYEWYEFQLVSVMKAFGALSQ